MMHPPRIRFVIARGRVDRAVAGAQLRRRQCERDSTLGWTYIGARRGAPQCQCQRQYEVVVSSATSQKSYSHGSNANLDISDGEIRIVVPARASAARIRPRFGRSRRPNGRFAATKARQPALTLYGFASLRAGFGGGFRQFDADLPAPSTGLAARERVFGPRGLTRRFPWGYYRRFPNYPRNKLRRSNSGSHPLPVIAS